MEFPFIAARRRRVARTANTHNAKSIPSAAVYGIASAAALAIYRTRHVNLLEIDMSSVADGPAICVSDFYTRKCIDTRSMMFKRCIHK